MSSDDGQTYTYRLALDTTLLDPDLYGAALEGASLRGANLSALAVRGAIL